MCDPVTIGLVTAGVGAASSVLGFTGATTQAHQAADMANLGYANTFNAEQSRASQIDAQQSENTLSAVIDRARAQGAISASASSLGSSGATVAREANASDNETGRGLAIEDLNSAGQRLQVQNELVGADISRRSKIASNPAPNPLSLVLGIAKAGLAGAGGYESAGGTFGSSAARTATAGAGGSAKELAGMG